MLEQRAYGMPIVMPKESGTIISNHILKPALSNIPGLKSFSQRPRRISGDVHMPEAMIFDHIFVDPFDPQGVCFSTNSPKMPNHRGLIPFFDHLEDQTPLS